MSAEGTVRMGLFKAAKKAVPKSVKEALRKALHLVPRRPFTPYLKKKTVEGVDFDFWIGDRDGRDWYDLHCTDPVWIELRFIRDHLVKAGDVILECGGHHGCTAIILSKWVGDGGRVVTFEPSPSNGDIIGRNIQQNKLTNVSLERKAVGAMTGTVRMNEASNSSVLLSGPGADVELIHLDQYEYLNPTLLKIDVEGFELKVLEGAKKILSTHPKMAIEIHADQLSYYGASVESLFKLIEMERYDVWIQWEDIQEPEKYDMKTPINKRVHLFFIPIAA